MEERIETLKNIMRGPKWARSDLFIKNLAFSLDLECEVERDTTFFREHIRFKVTGKESALLKFQKMLEQAAIKYNK